MDMAATKLDRFIFNKEHGMECDGCQGFGNGNYLFDIDVRGDHLQKVITVESSINIYYDDDAAFSRLRWISEVLDGLANRLDWQDVDSYMDNLLCCFLKWNDPYDVYVDFVFELGRRQLCGTLRYAPMMLYSILLKSENHAVFVNTDWTVLHWAVYFQDTRLLCRLLYFVYVD